MNLPVMLLYEGCVSSCTRLARARRKSALGNTAPHGSISFQVQKIFLEIFYFFIFLKKSEMMPSMVSNETQITTQPVHWRFGSIQSRRYDAHTRIWWRFPVLHFTSLFLGLTECRRFQCMCRTASGTTSACRNIFCLMKNEFVPVFIFPTFTSPHLLFFAVTAGQRCEYSTRLLSATHTAWTHHFIAVWCSPACVSVCVFPCICYILGN